MTCFDGQNISNQSNASFPVQIAIVQERFVLSDTLKKIISKLTNKFDLKIRDLIKLDSYRKSKFCVTKFIHVSEGGFKFT